jgi:hypothetical protein
MPLRSRHSALTVLFVVGGLTLTFFALRVDERLAVLLPAWLLFVALLSLFAIRCPRCRLPATVRILRVGKRRLWIPISEVNERCSGCGMDLRKI